MEGLSSAGPDEPVTVATFWDVFDADFLWTMLDLEGIPAVLEDRHLVQLAWHYANAIGGIRVRVRASDAPRARQLLRDTPIRPDSTRHAMRDPEHDLACPKCGSLEVRGERFSRFIFFLTWLFPGWPIPIPRRRIKCRMCKHIWRR
jgi:hypothetical protein